MWCCGVTSDEKQCKFGRQLSLSSRFVQFLSLCSQLFNVFHPKNGRGTELLILPAARRGAVHCAFELDLKQ